MVTDQIELTDPTAIQVVEARATSAEPLRHLLSALVKTGAGSLGSSLVSAISVKLLAAYLGPAHIGLWSTLQQTRQAAVICSTANGQTALVRGASAFSGTRRTEYLCTVLLLFAGATLLSTAALLLASGPIAHFLVGTFDPANASVISWLAVPVALGAAVTYSSALLNSVRAIGRLAVVQFVTSAATLLAVMPAIFLCRRGHPGALAGVLTASAVLSLVAALAFLRQFEIHGWFCRSGRWFSAVAARHFLSMSGAMLASSLLTSAALMAVRSGIIRQGGLYQAGIFDAGWAISMNYVTLVLASVQTYYLPTLSKMTDPAERVQLIRRVFFVSTLIVIPVIISVVVLKPLVLTVLYSRSFLDSAGVMRWMLIGDYLKVASWILAVPMLACADMKIFLAAECVAQFVFLSSSWALGTRLPAPESAAAGFAALYLINLFCCALYANRRHGFVPSRPAAVLWICGLAVILGASAHTWRDIAIVPHKVALWMVLSALLCGVFAFRKNSIWEAVRCAS